MENWAEIRRLHRSEKIPIKEIARKLGIARNTVRAALPSERPPKYERAGRGSLVDGVEMDVRKVLAEYPRMLATVIAERIGWQYSITTLKERIRAIRPSTRASIRSIGSPISLGRSCSVIHGFPEPKIPVGHGQLLMLPLLVMTLGFSRFLTATMIPSRWRAVLPCEARLSRGGGPVTPERATGLCLDLAGGVFSHAVAAGLDPDGVVHDTVHDRVGVNPGTETLVPILLGVLGAEHR